MSYAITLGDGQRVGLGAYAAAWRKVIQAPPEQRFSRSLCERWPASGAEIRRQYLQGLHDRINRHDVAYGKGRKWDQDWQRHAVFAAHQLNTPRLAISWLPQWLKGRFAHRIRSSWED